MGHLPNSSVREHAKVVIYSDTAIIGTGISPYSRYKDMILRGLCNEHSTEILLIIFGCFFLRLIDLKTV